MSLDKVLDIYKNWIKLYIEYSLKQGRSEQEIQKNLKTYRAPSSDEDYIFMIYTHDSIEAAYDEYWNNNSD